MKTDSEYSSKIFITAYHTTWGLKWDHIINPHHFEYLKSCTKKCVDGNVTLGRLHYRRAVCVLQTQHLVLHTLFTTCVHSVSYFASQTHWRKNIFEYSLVADIISALFYGQEHMTSKLWKNDIRRTITHAKLYTSNVNIHEIDTTAFNIHHVTTWNNLNMCAITMTR